MDKGGSVEHFHGSAQVDQFFIGGAQHLSGQQAQGGAEAFASRSQQVFEGGAQLGVRIVSLVAQ